MIESDRLGQDIHLTLLTACSRELRNDTFSKEQCLRKDRTAQWGMLHRMPNGHAASSGDGLIGEGFILGASPSSLRLHLPFAGPWGLCGWKLML
jgi:hypothetical protein